MEGSFGAMILASVLIVARPVTVGRCLMTMTETAGSRDSSSNAWSAMPARRAVMSRRGQSTHRHSLSYQTFNVWRSAS